MVANVIRKGQAPTEIDHFIHFAFAYHDARKGDHELLALFGTLGLDVIHCGLIQVFAELLDMRPLPEEKRLALVKILEIGGE